MKKQIDNKYNEINIIELINNSSYDSAKILSPLDKGADARYLNIYNKSGVSLLLDVCLSELKNAVHCCWVDYSCMATTMISKYNYGFEASALNLEYSDSNIIKNINTNLNKSISLLNSEYRNVYFHPDFLNGNHIAYISSIDAGGKDKANDDSSSFDYNKYNPEFSFCSGLTRLEQTNKDVHHQIDATRKRIETNKLSVNDFVEYMHKNYRETFLCMDERSRLSSFYICLPCIAPSHSSDSIYSSQTACFIFITVTDKHKEFVKNRLSEFSTYALLHSILSVISVNLPFVAAMNLKDINLKEAIKSAKSAIMSRNMSHNLGSHVMFYIKQKLQSVGKIVNDGILEDLFSKDGKLDSKKLNGETIHEETEMPFLVGLGRFINYLQERQDYIATIATDYIPARSTISFKDFIYDELKPDLRYKRHKKIDLDGNKKDMVSGEEPRNLLLDYIAYSEKYEGSDSIVINFGKFNGSKASSKDAGKDDFDKLRKFNVSLPGGVIGRQAFFSIIENIIRNAAKHSLKAANIVLDFEEVDVAELRTRALEYIVPKGQKGYTGAANTKLPSTDLIELYEKNSNDYSILRITSNMQNEEKSIETLVKKLASDYVDEQGTMDETAKGLKEIRISAAWMRGYSIDLDIPINKEPPAVTIAKTIKENTNKYKIEYYICLPKPKNFAFVVKKKPALNINPEIYGCKIYTLDEISSPTKGVAAEIANYDVVVFCCAGAEDNLKKYISPRYISYVEDNIQMLEIFKRSDKILDALQESVYSKWFKQKVSQDDIRISVLDDKAYNKNKLKSSNSADGESKQEKAEQDNGVTLSTTGSATDDCYNKTVLFTTHYEGRASKNPMLNGNSSYDNVLFAEGITGNNSTDRLIRQNEWNAEWRYKHLAAGLLRVAIFDERIFSYVASATDNSINEAAIDDLITSCIGVSDYDSIYQLVKEKLHIINKVDTIYKIADILEANESTAKESVKAIVEESVQSKKQPYDCFKSQQLHEKRINVYDVYCKNDESGRYIEFVGYNAPINDNVAKYNSSSNIAVLATLRKKDDGYVVEFEADGLMQNKFDLISIHQGILDKIYEHFSIKGDETAMEIITDKLVAEFARKAEGSRLSIHSGRSRPNKSDMPQHVPFVQFAAIDHAVRDCKYTLSELLLTSHYEMRTEDIRE